jgi:hypothetical protein
MPQQGRIEQYAPGNDQGIIDEINASLQEFTQILSGEGPATRVEEVVTQETQEEVPPPPAQDIPPEDETNAQARLRAARSALANNPFGTRTA